MNIRQSGRRRGRNNNNGGGNRPQSGGRGGQDSGNRIDSRTRGNAAQMIEKYKNLARDAQLSGDRVQTEYYLQFADHYFRVLSDFRARQDEGRPQGQERWQGRNEGVENFDGRDDMDLGDPETSGNGNSYQDDEDGDDRSDAPRRDDRGDAVRREGRDNRGNGGNRDNRPREGNRDSNRQRPERAERTEREDRPERNERAEQTVRPDRAAGEERGRARRPRRDANGADHGDDGANGIDTAVLPPAIARPVEIETGAAEPVAEAAPKVRRPRRTLTKPVSAAETAE